MTPEERMGDELCKYCGINEHPSHMCNGMQLRKQIDALTKRVVELEEALRDICHGGSYEGGLPKWAYNKAAKALSPAKEAK